MRSTIVATVLALATLVAVPAFAAPAQGTAPAKTQRAEGDKGAKHFPMPAAEFQAKVNARQTKARAHMEEKAAQLPADQAKELRTRFDANIAKVNAEVAKAVADGTVTKEEAQAVRAASPHHGKHARNGKKGGAKK
ncbi:MAG: hypothetical protein JWO86_219 [Myxococcaceae bacterium]|jgi:hypothetical protein|nr:hypothetical protein [Myxococcaceae bacterium]MEA2751413.1 hypothetical protein [Myxococcales bacterium]